MNSGKQQEYDKNQKSVREEQMTLFIVICRVSSLGLMCFDGFLAGFGVNYEYTESRLNTKLLKPSASGKRLFMIKNVCDMYHPRSPPHAQENRYRKRRDMSVNDLY